MFKKNSNTNVELICKEQVVQKFILQLTVNERFKHWLHVELTTGEFLFTFHRAWTNDIFHYRIH